MVGPILGSSGTTGGPVAVAQIIWIIDKLTTY